MRTPIFELHILPMIRATDRDHMAFAYDLWDYDKLRENAASFLKRVAVDMPPSSTGGPWPQEWVDLFRRWTETGFKRLELGTAQWTRTQTASRVTINGAGTLPSPGHRAWLQIDTQTDAAKTYVLYVEKAEDVPDQPTPFTVRERYPATDTRQLFMRDSTGAHELPPPPPPPPSLELAIEVEEMSDREFWGMGPTQQRK